MKKYLIGKGYATRQFYDMCINVIYKKDMKSPDKYGVLLKEEDCIGRKVLDTVMVNGKKWYRVASCATNNLAKYKKIICGDEIAHNVYYKGKNGENEISKYNLEDGDTFEKFTARDGSCLGISFSTSITENLTQSGLGFKHGGDLVLLDKIELTAPVMLKFEEQDGDYLVFTAMEPWKNFKAGDELRYRITHASVISVNLIPGNIVIPGQMIMKKSIAVRPDDTLAKIFTLTGARNSNENLGKKLDTSESWSLNKGVINYTDKECRIGQVSYKLDEDEMYLYPQGMEIDVVQQICSGVPDMNGLKKISDKLYGDDYGILYSIFYYYIRTIGAFSKFNSEPFELLFKVLADYHFKVDDAIAHDEDLITRLFHGASVKQMQNFVTEIVHGEKVGNEYVGGVQYKYNKRVANLINANVDEIKQSELSAKSTDTSVPTIRKINIARNFDNAFDWRGLFKLMNIEATKNNEPFVKWDWDKIKDNLRMYYGTKTAAKNGHEIPLYTVSIASCRERAKNTPNRTVKIAELETEKKRIMDELDPDADEETINDAESRIESIDEQIKIWQNRDVENMKDYWNAKLTKAKGLVDSVSNVELNRQLTTWLTRGKYGSSLKPYVTNTNTYVKLKITKPNYTDDEEDEVNEIETKIRDLRNQQLKLDDTKESQRKKIDKLEDEIKDLNDQKRKVVNQTKPHGIVNKADNWIGALIMARK